MLTCKDAARLTSNALDQPLPWLQRMNLRMHMLVCSACRNFSWQMHWIQGAGREYTEHVPGESPESTLSPEARERIQSALEQESLRD